MVDCPECEEEMEKRSTRTNPRRTSVRWMCQNPNCPVIFVEYGRGNRGLTIVRDPTMARLERVTERVTERELDTELEAK